MLVGELCTLIPISKEMISNEEKKEILKKKLEKLGEVYSETLIGFVMQLLESLEQQHYHWHWPGNIQLAKCDSASHVHRLASQMSCAILLGPY